MCELRTICRSSAIAIIHPRPYYDRGSRNVLPRNVGYSSSSSSASSSSLTFRFTTQSDEFQSVAAVAAAGEKQCVTLRWWQNKGSYNKNKKGRRKRGKRREAAMIGALM